MKRWYATALANMAGSEAGEVIGRVDVDELGSLDSDNSSLELVECSVQREVPLGQAALERRERRPAICARERTGGRNGDGDLGAGGGEGGQALRLDPRRVDREHDAELVRGRAQTG